MSTYGNNIADRYHSDRTYMTLIFPQKGKGAKTKASTSNTKIKIPFYETPFIVESKSSRLSTYKLLGRNSDLYSFLGSDSKTVGLEMNITLYHLFNFMKTAPWMQGSMTTTQTPKFQFLKRNVKSDSISTKDKLDTKATLLARKSPNGQVEPNDKQGAGGLAAKESIYDAIQEFDGLSANDKLFAQVSQDPQSVRASYLYYINLIRSCVLGSEELGLGPPIIRLNYGPLYRDVPFIATKYDLEIDQDAGIEVTTLLPKRVKFKLELLELRVGDFTTHTPEKYGESDDNVPTWESVLNYGTLDPRIEPKGLNGSDTTFDYVKDILGGLDNVLRDLRR